MRHSKDLERLDLSCLGRLNKGFNELFALVAEALPLFKMLFEEGFEGEP